MKDILESIENIWYARGIAIVRGCWCLLVFQALFYGYLSILPNFNTVRDLPNWVHALLLTYFLSVGLVLNFFYVVRSSIHHYVHDKQPLWVRRALIVYLILLGPGYWLIHFILITIAVLMTCLAYPVALIFRKPPSYLEKLIKLWRRQ